MILLVLLGKTLTQLTWRSVAKPSLVDDYNAGSQPKIHSLQSPPPSPRRIFIATLLCTGLAEPKVKIYECDVYDYPPPL